MGEDPDLIELADVANVADSSEEASSQSMVHEGKGKLVRDTTRAIRVEAAKMFDDNGVDGGGDGGAQREKTPPEIPGEVERGTWSNPLDFLFSCISVSVGLGNVWRFPYLCYKNGGGVFLIIYFISMIFCGIPIFLLEVSIGQYLGSGGMTAIAQLVPILKGVGIATMVMVTYYNIYYCVIVAWSVYYFIASFIAIPGLPWDNCDGWWNSDNCWMKEMNTTANNKSVPPAQEFWSDRVLQKNDGLEYGLGALQYELIGALLAGWIIVYGIIRRGLHQSGYVIWFTALFPYVVMVTLLAKALTLEGASKGLEAYVQIDWSYMQNGTTWIDAATQIFFAYSVGTGALSALGSYNKFNHNCFRDALITCVINTCTCLTAGVLVFAILGYMAHLQDKTVAEVATSGPGLVFLTYPELVLSLPISFFWAIIFFAMLLVLGIDTEFCSVESLITGCVDNWPATLLPHRKLFTVLVCVALFLLGLPMLTEGGIYLFQIMDFYAASGMSLLWICFFETIAVAWFYGVNKFAGNIEEMMGSKRGIVWNTFMLILKLCWSCFAPLVMIGVLVMYIASCSAVTYDDYKYPGWAEGMGLCISFSSMIWVPAYFIYYLITGPGTIRENFQRGITPNIRMRKDAVANGAASGVEAANGAAQPFLNDSNERSNAEEVDAEC